MLSLWKQSDSCDAGSVFEITEKCFREMKKKMCIKKKSYLSGYKKFSDYMVQSPI